MKRILTRLILILAFCIVTYGQADPNTCPKFSISAPAIVLTPGDLAKFEATIDGLSGPVKYQYVWTISAGHIQQGQGTAKIMVIATKEDAGTNISISLSIKGLEAGCPNAFTEIAAIASQPSVDYFNNYGRLTKRNMRSTLDDFYFQINNNPGYEGVIVFNFGDDESRKEKLARLKMIVDAIRFRHYDPTRIAIAIANKPSYLEYTFWIVPSPADVPGGLGEHTLFKGEKLINNLGAAFPVKRKK